MKKTKKSEMGTIGKLTPSLSYMYNNKKIPAKCSEKYVRSFYEDEKYITPKIVMVEPVSICNLSCLMCPTHLTQKPKSFMTLELFKQIVDECKSYQEFFVFQGTGEPFLHPELFDMIKYAKENGIKNISVSTNGTLINDKNIDKILDIKTSPDFLQFSIDGHTRELFQKYRKGANFDNVYDGMKKLFLKREQRELQDLLEISINTLLSKEFDLDKFLDLWGGNIDDMTVGVMLNQAAQKVQEKDFIDSHQAVNKNEYISCPKPFESLSILSNGQISHCQHDFHHLHIKGDMYAGDGLLQTWRNEEYKDFRQKHIDFKAEETSCNGCEHMYRIKDEDLLFQARKEIKSFFKSKGK